MRVEELETPALLIDLDAMESNLSRVSEFYRSGPVKARIPLHRFGEQVEIADLVLYLASPASDFICGQVIVIDGGYSAV